MGSEQIKAAIAARDAEALDQQKMEAAQEDKKAKAIDKLRAAAQARSLTKRP